MGIRESWAEMGWPMRLWSAVLMGMVIGLVALLIVHTSFTERIEQEIAAIREAGHPATLSDYDTRKLAQHEEPNAADMYSDAVALTRRADGERREDLPLNYRSLLPPGGTLSDETRIAAIDYLESRGEFLELIEQASGIQNCRFDVDTSPGLGMVIPNYLLMFDAMFLLRMRAVVESDAGNPVAAVDDGMTILRMATQMGQEPCLAFVADTLASSAVNCWEDTLCRTPLDAATLRILREAILSAEATLSIVRLVEWDFAIGSLFFDEPSQVIPRSDLPRGFSSKTAKRVHEAKIRIYVSLGLLHLDHLHFVRVQRQMLTLVKDSPSSRWSQAQSLQTDVRARSRIPHLTQGATAETMHHVGRAMERIAVGRAAVVALAAEEYRLNHGELPDQLESLVPAYLDRLPVDPFTGGNLRYVKTVEGFLVYSLGANQADDGGSHLAPSRSDYLNDVVFQTTYPTRGDPKGRSEFHSDAPESE